MVDAGDNPRHPELRLGEEGDDEVDLVVSGRGHHDLALCEVCFLQGGELTGVRLQHLGAVDGSRPGEFGVTVDEEYVVAESDELACDGPAHLAGARNGNLHEDPSKFMKIPPGAPAAPTPARRPGCPRPLGRRRR